MILDTGHWRLKVDGRDRGERLTPMVQRKIAKYEIAFAVVLVVAKSVKPTKLTTPAAVM